VRHIGGYREKIHSLTFAYTCQEVCARKYGYIESASSIHTRLRLPVLVSRIRAHEQLTLPQPRLLHHPAESRLRRVPPRGIPSMRRRRPKIIEFLPTIILDRQMTCIRVVARRIGTVQRRADMRHAAVPTRSCGSLIVGLLTGKVHRGFCIDGSVVRAFYCCLPGGDCWQRRRCRTRLVCGLIVPLGVMLRCSHEDFDSFRAIAATRSVSS
jgi:hypothetical protein